MKNVTNLSPGVITSTPEATRFRTPPRPGNHGIMFVILKPFDINDLSGSMLAFSPLPHASPTAPRPSHRLHLFSAALAFALAAWLLAPAGLLASPSDASPSDASPVRYVIHISVDGLRPDAVTRHDVDELPHFYRLRREGAFTDKAHTDFDYSNTLPNHAAQLTGRPVVGEAGHHWMTNKDPLPGETLHTRRGAYVASVFDVAHDHGLRTAAYASKSKFVIFDRSYDATHGAPDVTGSDDGRDKIDTFVIDADTEDLVERFVRDMEADPYGYAFLHLRNPDTQGHRWGWRLWKWHPYMRAVRHVDDLLGQVFALVDGDPRLAGNTAIILTADHGGRGHDHGRGTREHYTVPFYVWGPGVDADDLYTLNADIRLAPERDRPGFDAATQPIRNGSAANLALALLGLGPVPGSSINADPGMLVRHPVAPVIESVTATAPEGEAGRRR